MASLSCFTTPNYSVNFKANVACQLSLGLMSDMIGFVGAPTIKKKKKKKKKKLDPQPGPYQYKSLFYIHTRPT